MNKILFFVLLTTGFSITTFSQQLPIGSCGIVNVYDVTGNRTKRIYFCNNGSDPYPTVIRPGDSNIDPKEKIQELPASTDLQIQETDALYPNPTTGKFTLTFSKRLTNALVSILDNSGKTIHQFRASGNVTGFDLSPYASGMYYVRIEENGKIINKKVIKQ